MPIVWLGNRMGTCTTISHAPTYNQHQKYLPGTADAPFFQNERLLDCSKSLLPTADIIFLNFTF